MFHTNLYFKMNIFRRLKIKDKLLLYILSVTGLVFITSISVLTYRNHQKSIRNTYEIANKASRGFANEIEKKFEQELSIVKTLAKNFDIHRKFDSLEWQPLINQMHRQTLENNPQFYALWDSWEYSYLYDDWNLPHGRFLNYHFRKDGTIQYDLLERSLDGDPPLYGAAKQSAKPLIWEPYPDQLEVGATNTTLMTTFTVPMFADNQYIGLVGADITLTSLQELVASIRPFDESYAFLVSNKGLIAAHPSEAFLEKSVSEYFQNTEDSLTIFQNIESGVAFSLQYVMNNQDYHYVFSPVEIADTGTPWSLIVAIPQKVISQEAGFQRLFSLILGLLGFVIVFIIVWWISRYISNNLHQITELMKRLSKGEIDKSMFWKVDSEDEFNDMAVAFNDSIKGLLEKAHYADKIGNGELDTSLELLGENDSLGKSLNEMKENLKKAREEEEKRVEENKIRNWMSEGYAKFGDLLRSNNEDMESLSFVMIKNIVKYLNANQGGVFVAEKENGEDVLSLKACYAFDRKKYLEKTILPGEGFVGACYWEKKTTYMKKIPQDYINITSGLGGENPSILLIVPLKVNEEVYGVMEIASFNELEKNQIEFVEKIAENFASTISTTKINIRTAELLKKSQQQTEEMKSQEEEMRQNMEELSATQEEMERKSTEMEGILGALNSTSYIIEMELDGSIINISDSYLKIINLSKQQVVGQKFTNIFEYDQIQKEEFDNFWKEITQGAVKSREVRTTLNNQSYWMSETYAPIKNTDGEIFKIFKIATNITLSKTKVEFFSEENAKLKAEIRKLQNEG